MRRYKYNNVSCDTCKIPPVDKIKVLYDLLGRKWSTINAYLYSKEYWDGMIVKPIQIVGDTIIAKVKSKASDEVYDVIINITNDIYYCTCNSYTFKKYIVEIPEEMKGIFKKRDIAICPHILKVLEYVLRKRYFSTK